MESIAKHAKRKRYFITIPSLVIVVDGILLVIYGLATGVNAIAIIFAFIFESTSGIGARETYVLIGLLRIILPLSLCGIRNNGNAAYASGLIFLGVFLICFAFSGFVYCLLDGVMAASNVYWIVIECIAMLVVPSLYFIGASHLKKS